MTSIKGHSRSLVHLPSTWSSLAFEYSCFARGHISKLPFTKGIDSLVKTHYTWQGFTQASCHLLKTLTSLARTHYNWKGLTQANCHLFKDIDVSITRIHCNGQ